MTQIILKDHGILPNTDCTLALAELFAEHPCDTEFIFESGDYHFSPKIFRDLRLSNTDVLPQRKIGVILENNGFTEKHAEKLDKIVQSGMNTPIKKDNTKFLSSGVLGLAAGSVATGFGVDQVASKITKKIKEE